ncbi:MAG: hypothetical protein Q6356_003200 [Candidatus Wukongarchaeota archaeon]|nr:tyrosine-type recombinase/integrase [Candidatus Wukongarchaeota archaeon]
MEIIKTLPNYTRNGKILKPLTHKEFLEGMAIGHFTGRFHRAYLALLYYSGVRKNEALRAQTKQFRIRNKNLVFDVGQRLKHSKKTDPLEIPLELEYVENICDAVRIAKENNREKVFNFSERTAYNIVSRVFHYPHHLRLSRITNFFLSGHDIASLQSWTGLTLQSLNYYVGRIETAKMTTSLRKTG